MNAKEFLMNTDEKIYEAVINGYDIRLEETELLAKMELYAEYKLNNLIKPDVSGSSSDDFTDEEDYIDEPCPTCGDVNGMVNPCCAGYDPLHYRNCGYG